jgi:hypothetical protein
MLHGRVVRTPDDQWFVLARGDAGCHGAISSRGAQSLQDDNSRAPRIRVDLESSRHHLLKLVNPSLVGRMSRYQFRRLPTLTCRHHPFPDNAWRPVSHDGSPVYEWFIELGAHSRSCRAVRSESRRFCLILLMSSRLAGIVRGSR